MAREALEIELRRLHGECAFLSGGDYAYRNAERRKILLQLESFRSLTEWEVLCLGEKFTGYVGPNDGSGPSPQHPGPDEPPIDVAALEAINAEYQPV